MGKKHQRDREEKRERYAARQARQNNKNKIIAIGALAAVAAIVGYAGYTFTTITVDAPGGPEGAGPLNSDHAHAGILVKIFGDTFDFSLPAYQIKTPWIHFEGQNGDTIHRHATGVKTGYLFDSIGIVADESCYVFPDEREFCTDDTYSLKYYVNGERRDSVSEYVVQEDDRILISYGDETDDEIGAQLAELDSIALDIRG